MRILYLSLIVILLDQLSKILVKGINIPAIGFEIRGMSYGESIPLIQDVLHITFIENPNMAFGIELGGKVFLALFALLASAALILYLYRIRGERLRDRIAIAMVIGGAIGNLVDRIFYGLWYTYAPIFQGNVVDFIDINLFTINWGTFHFKFWPIFNVADAAVSIGVVTLLLFHRPHKTGSPTETAEELSRISPDPVESESGVPQDEVETNGKH